MDDAKGRAKFDKGRSELTIVLPVQKPAMQPARAGAPQAGAPGQEEGEKAEAEEVGGEADAPGADRASGGGMSGSSGGNEAEERVAGEPLSADGEELAKGESDGGESKDRSGEGRRDVEAPVETENQRRWRELHAPRAPTDKVGQEGETSAGEDAERRGAEAGEAPSARAEVPAFVPCGGYDGPREGMAFKMGPRGLGYYRDAGPWAAVQSQGEGERGVEPKARRAVVRPRIEVSAIDELD